MCAVKSQLRESSILLAERKSNELPSNCDVYAEPTTLEELECRTHCSVLTPAVSEHGRTRPQQCKMVVGGQLSPADLCMYVHAVTNAG